MSGGYTCFHCKLTTDNLEEASWFKMLNHQCFQNSVNVSIDDSNVLYLEGAHDSQNTEDVTQDILSDSQSGIPDEPQSGAWTQAAVLLLIQQYEEYKEVLGKKNSMKKHIWQKIAMAMNAFGHNFSWDQLQNKWKSLVRTYKSVKDNNNRSGRDRSNWTYFEAMDHLLKKDPSIEPPITIHNGNINKRAISPTSDNKPSEDGNESVESDSGASTPERPPVKKTKHTDVKDLLLKAIENSQKQHEEEIVEKGRFNDLLEQLVTNLRK
ncbi:uncharacterized protein LOC116159691 [Photinus pyralis]|uniref:uncharacterized protein LOC116159691 n=1 Tax=Photinus pyralis TaxID=7054 RepID=UPI0012670969|nr:uncharacterized protein LOC116159691 [Photinus pyralis]